MQVVRIVIKARVDVVEWQPVEQSEVCAKDIVDGVLILNSG